MSTELLDRLSVLSDATRARLLDLLDGHELTVSELCDVVQLPQSTVSRHLKTLADAGLVASRRDGTSRFYGAAHGEQSPHARKLWLLVKEELAASVAHTQDDQRLRGILARRKTRSEEFFSSSAGQWDRLRDELFGASSPLQALLGWLDERWVVGDLGCGTGQVSQVVAPFVHRVVAVDASAEMLDAARARLSDESNVELRRGALEQLPLGDEELDAACMMLVLHHVADPGKAVAEAWRTLKPGARLLVVDMLPHDREDYRLTMGHVWLGFSQAQFGRVLESAGFEAMRWRVLPVDPKAKGPALFVAMARRGPRREPAPGGTDRSGDVVSLAAGRVESVQH